MLFEEKKYYSKKLNQFTFRQKNPITKHSRAFMAPKSRYRSHHVGAHPTHLTAGTRHSTQITRKTSTSILCWILRISTYS